MASAARKKTPKVQVKKTRTGHSVKASAPAAGAIIAPVSSEPYLEAFQNLQRATPRDQNGFLTHLLDHNHIPPDINERTGSKHEALINNAKLPLTMLEGYLSLNTPTHFSHPVWSQLPHEPDSYFSAFRHYLLSHDRSLQSAQETLPPGFTPFTLKEAYILFYWVERARAYDIQRPVAAARLRDQRILMAEDQHYLLSQQLLSGLTLELRHRADDMDDRPYATMKTAEVFNAILASVEMQRVSIGLPAKGPKLKENGFTPNPHAGIDRNIRESAANYNGSSEDKVNSAQKMRELVDQAMADNPDVAAAMQAAAVSAFMHARQLAQPTNNDTDIKQSDKSSEDQPNINVDTGE